MILITWLMLLSSAQKTEVFDAYLSAFLAQNRLSQEDLTNYFYDKFEPRLDQGGPVCVALKDGKIVAFSVFEKWEEDTYYLAEMAVAADQQHQGIGKKLVFSIFDKDPSAKRIVLLTERANQDSQAFYKAIGFTPSSFQHPNYSPEQFMGFEYSK